MTFDRIIVVLLTVGFSIPATAHADLHKRSDEWYCRLDARTPEIKTYDRIDFNLPGTDDNLRPYGKIKDFSSVFSKRECERFFDPAVTRVTDGPLFYDKADLIHEKDLPRIRHWKTRYVYWNHTFTAQGGETGSHKKELTIDSSLEIEAYQAATIRNNLLMFAPDGRYFHPETQTWWDMYLSDRGTITLRDPTGVYFPTGYEVPNGLKLDCKSAESDCGYFVSDSSAKYVSGTTRLLQNLPDFRPVKVLPDQRFLTQRLSSLTKFKSFDSFLFYATFDDPIRPVFFAPGVLFKSKAKPNARGRYPKSDLVNQPVCLADCPDQLKLQGLYQ